jgi:hypothetical protein
LGDIILSITTAKLRANGIGCASTFNEPLRVKRDESAGRVR